ncbi:MAG: diphosphomevalonate decarboxylase [Bacteroidetes bacterium]|nr:diphosphomevalonate decarboxylase [Bacteroidota bacterium]
MKELKKVSWRSPSNIALVKYWGKHGNQLPSNPSISFTLDQCYSETSLSISEKESKNSKDKGLELKFYFDKKENLAFRIKILSFFEGISKDFPFLSKYALSVNSTNSFPHSSGIASSASAMSALALCLVEMNSKLSGTKVKPDTDKLMKNASYYARIGSGSASRSIYPVASLWGAAHGVKGSSDEYAIPYEKQVNKVFKTYQNSILIASSAEKKVSSRVGHTLMKTNPFAKARYKQANENLTEVLDALKSGDLEKFGTITETEAMTLHALMMCSSPNFILMTPSTLAMIEKIKAFRESTKLPLYFTLDAGPNIHLLYPENIKSKVIPFIQADLSEHCENGKIIWDKVGKGPASIK